ncbi:MAG: hypothetical protein ACRDF9_02615 [Candidatus Limnocylindria bacterium]
MRRLAEANETAIVGARPEGDRARHTDGVGCAGDWIVDWIGAILGRIRTMECPACGARLASCAVRGITAEPQALVVKLACTVCGESSVAIVEREEERMPALTKDDVLDAHDFLETWHGPVAELIKTA